MFTKSWLTKIKELTKSSLASEEGDAISRVKNEITAAAACGQTNYCRNWQTRFDEQIKQTLISEGFKVEPYGEDGFRVSWED